MKNLFIYLLLSMICFLLTSCLNREVEYDELGVDVLCYKSLCQDTLEFDYSVIKNISRVYDREIIKKCNSDVALNKIFDEYRMYNVHYNGSIVNTHKYHIRLISFQAMENAVSWSSYIIANHADNQSLISIIPVMFSEVDNGINIRSQFVDNNLIVFKTNVPDYDTGAKMKVWSYSIFDFSNNGKIKLLKKEQARTLITTNAKIKAALNALILSGDP